MTTPTLQLIVDQAHKSQPLFKNVKDYQAFRESFHARIKPKLDSQQKARRKSEAKAKQHFVG